MSKMSDYQRVTSEEFYRTHGAIESFVELKKLLNDDYTFAKQDSDQEEDLLILIFRSLIDLRDLEAELIVKIGSVKLSCIEMIFPHIGWKKGYKYYLNACRRELNKHFTRVSAETKRIRRQASNKRHS